ncbi:MAG TPA: von Willebrand factor type A domain-containing protein [Thermoanaerobaculia bacterium]
MNSKRRAELQRKLTLNAVPRPPAGLAERIKADIPKYLEPETVPQRVTRSLTFTLRIAASLIVVVGAVVVAMTVARQRPEKMAASAARPVIFAPAPREIAAADTTTTVSAVARTEEVQLDIVQEAPPVVARQIAEMPVAPTAMAPQPEAASAADSDVESGVEGRASYGVAGGVVGGVAAGTAGGRAEEERAEPQRVAQYAPEVPAVPLGAPAPDTAISVTAEAPALPPSAAPAVAPSDEAFAETRRLDRRQEPTAAKMTGAGPREREAKKESVFGISVSPQVFQNIRTTLQSGQRPPASAVDVEALVNYFAGAPARLPRRVSLEVEASPAVISAEGEHAVLRFTIDTPAGSGIAASDARIDVVINDAAVAQAKRIGDADPLARESALPYGTSVTGLYALEMKPGLKSTHLVATVRLHYTVNGKPATITKLIEGRDLMKSWQRSSRRHRLASLGALWAESLKGPAAGGADVARRAEELATQEPADVRARELARAASASAAGGR